MLEILEDSSFFQTLQSLDKDTYLAAKLGKCRSCEGPLDDSHYLRKPRGQTLVHLDKKACIRYSLCCRNDGCRKRIMPASLRFAGRKVYCALFILVYLSLKERGLEAAAKIIQTNQNLDQKTSRRWLTLLKSRLELSAWRKSFNSLNIFLSNQPIKLTDIFSLIGPKNIIHAEWGFYLKTAVTLWPELS